MNKREITYTDWIEEGNELFGDDTKKWEFVCPICGMIQSFELFKEKTSLTDEQIGTQVGFSCIGRNWSSEVRTIFDSNNKEIKQPCNYTLGGLLKFNTLIIIKDMKKIPFFEFNK